MDISAALEAILFAAGESVPLARLSLVLDTDETELEQIARELADRYEREERGMRILFLEDKLRCARRRTTRRSSSRPWSSESRPCSPKARWRPWPSLPTFSP